jgi:putative membrane protein insertion efficiency factor
MKQAIKFVLRCYQRVVSPMLPHSCRFVPTCSQYAIEAVECHGVLSGGLLAAARLLRCHPFARAGCDPVPLAIAKPEYASPDGLRRNSRPLNGT